MCKLYNQLIPLLTDVFEILINDEIEDAIIVFLLFPSNNLLSFKVYLCITVLVFILVMAIKRGLCNGWSVVA